MTRAKLNPFPELVPENESEKKLFDGALRREATSPGFGWKK